MKHKCYLFPRPSLARSARPKRPAKKTLASKNLLLKAAKNALIEWARERQRRLYTADADKKTHRELEEQSFMDTRSLMGAPHRRFACVYCPPSLLPFDPRMLPSLPSTSFYTIVRLSENHDQSQCCLKTILGRRVYSQCWGYNLLPAFLFGRCMRIYIHIGMYTSHRHLLQVRVYIYIGTSHFGIELGESRLVERRKGKKQVARRRFEI